MCRKTVSYGNLNPGDVIAGTAAEVKRVWVASDPTYVMYEYVGGGIRTAYRAATVDVVRCPTLVGESEAPSAQEIRVPAL